MEISNITNAMLHKSVISTFFCVLIAILFVCPRAQGENVVWTNLVNATANGNTLTKTSGCGDCNYDSGAISQQQIDSAGGYIEFTPSYGKWLFAGLGNDLSNATDYDNIKYAFHFWGGGGGDWDIREGWVNNRASGTYVAGDVFRISVASGVVTYYKNGQLIYTSQVARRVHCISQIE